MLDLPKDWYKRSLTLTTLLLLPISWIYAAVIWCRRQCYRLGVIRSRTFSRPLIVVGNMTVGGTGKTPLVIWLAQQLKALGYKPGIVSRGYGGRKHQKPMWVSKESSASLVGDEPLLLQRLTKVPVVVCVDRVKAVSDLINKTDCDIVIADDGLQHYRLQPDIKIAVVDGERGFGNGYLLPAGPLREPISRLTQADIVAYQQTDLNQDHAMMLVPTSFVHFYTQQSLAFTAFPHKTIHAIAGIGHPERFFNSLRRAGFEVIAHAYPDHHHFSKQDLSFNDAYPIVMTEKDAVKCENFADHRCFYVKVEASLHPHLAETIINHVKEYYRAKNNSMRDSVINSIPSSVRID